MERGKVIRKIKTKKNCSYTWKHVIGFFFSPRGGCWDSMAWHGMVWGRILNAVANLKKREGGREEEGERKPPQPNPNRRKPCFELHLSEP